MIERCHNCLIRQALTSGFLQSWGESTGLRYEQPCYFPPSEAGPTRSNAKFCDWEIPRCATTTSVQGDFFFLNQSEETEDLRVNTDCMYTDVKMRIDITMGASETK